LLLEHGMELEELEIHRPCVVCGEIVAEGLTPFYELADERVLCLGCALQRGGRHDPTEDRWIVPPQTSDLEPEPVEKV
jgi:hypothetical protein